MRLDIPQDVPRRRDPELRQPDTPLKPSPVETRRGALDARAADRREMPQIPQNRRPQHIAHESGPGQHMIAVDRQMDQRPRRQTIDPQAIGLALREEERKLLTEVGRFRVISTRDLAETIYHNRSSRMERDLAFLREKGLIHVDTVNARRDGRGGRVKCIEVATLTKGGQSLAQAIGELPQDQKLYVGMVKPREVEHDAQIYRAYRKEARRIEEKGGTNLRVRLDFELKSQIQKTIYAERKANPTRGVQDIKEQVARKFELPFVDGGIKIPDARIEYDLPRHGDQDPDQGSRSGHEDIEVLTSAYRPGHLRHKAQAGFHVYASSTDRATLTSKIEGEHRLMERIMEL